MMTSVTILMGYITDTFSNWNTAAQYLTTLKATGTSEKNLHSKLSTISRANIDTTSLEVL